jgi:2-methylcitrate dehydratase PrpD
MEKVPLHVSTLHDQAGVARTIAEYVEARRGEVVAYAEREAVFRCIFDLIGAAAAGIHECGVRAVRGVAVTTMRTGNVPVWFSGSFSSVVGAAWANSSAASALDLDDGHRLARGHPGAAVIPVALAVAHETRATLDEVVSAIVIGYEVGVTVGAARTTYGNTGTWSAYAAVATAGALRRTSVDVLTHALAIAGESAPNQLFASAPSQKPPPEGSDVKEGIPWSVVTGLIALDLAEAGYTGPRNILNSALLYRFPVPILLGANSHIRNSYFKLYACCRHIHAPLDALLGLIHRHGIEVQAIDAIEVETYSGALRISNKSHPTSLVDIQYSIPYCLALVATFGRKALLPLTTDALNQGDVSSLAEKVQLSVDSTLDARFPEETLARVVITSCGKRFVSDVTAPQGEASSPLSWEALVEKFNAATRAVASDDQRKQLLKAINGAKSGNLSELTECLGAMTLHL